ncbi:MAG: FprA family A-type flavoprotein [Clostridioides sp.]|jgi:flavorubredoxin|nr:FprA family A-type flavoprotein [Clostridioides sp.]
MEKTFEIKKDLHYVGVIDKDLEVFDIIMDTKYGTTYNAYLLKDEKTVLFDTVKENFREGFCENLNSLTDVSKIDYVVVHHTEPDHAGCLKFLLDKNPDVVVYCTKAAKLYLDGQINKPFNCHVITDGEVLNVGKRNLRFITAPFLHWADTMFTYIEEEKTLLTCDAFGTHYSSVDPKAAISNPDYDESTRIYYECIVRPFAKHVLNAINKVVELGLEFDTILTSHGPILSENPMLMVTRYAGWATEDVDFVNQNKAAVFYLSAYNNTLHMGQKIVDTLNAEGVTAELYDLENMNLKDIHDAVVTSKVLLLGSPTINKTMVKPMWDLFSVIDPVLNQGKIAGVFGSYGWSGEGVTIAQNLIKSMGFKSPVEPLKKKFTPSGVTYEDCEEFATGFVQFLK